MSRIIYTSFRQIIYNKPAYSWPEGINTYIIMQLTYDLQPIVKNTSERAIVKGNRSKHCRSVVADQIATNRISWPKWH